MPTSWQTSDRIRESISVLETVRTLVGHRRMLLQLGDAVAAMLPEGWFELHSLGTTGSGTVSDHYMLDRVGGPPVGSFRIWCDDEFIHARALPEPGHRVESTPWTGHHHDVPETVRAIVGAINAQLRTWDLPSLPSDADRRNGIVMVLRPDLVRSFVSPSSRDILGYAPDELLGRHPRGVIHPEDWPRIPLLLALCRQTGEPIRDVHRVRHKDGGLLWVESRYTPRADGGYAVLLNDIGSARS